MKQKNIISNQELFFNQHSHQEGGFKQHKIFETYVNKEQVDGFIWLKDRRKILDYGCGIGGSIDLMKRVLPRKKFTIYGVDIAEDALKRASKKYPEFYFYRVKNNRIKEIKDSSMDGAYMLHVLHHARGHKEIFETIYKKLDKDGMFLINDLCSQNLFNKTARSLFIHMPKFVKNRFSDDLVVGESIPEKYKVNVEKVISDLKKVGFTIEEVGYGHLFFFLFGWIDRFVPLSRSRAVTLLYRAFIALENNLLNIKFFQNKAEVFYIKCIKK